MEYNSSFRLFRQYRQPDYQLNRQSAFVSRVPVPERPILADRESYGKSKSKATRARNKIRKPNFIERKTVCSRLLYFRLDDDEAQNEMANNNNNYKVLIF